MTLSSQLLTAPLLDHRGLDLDAAGRITYVLEQSFAMTTTRRWSHCGSGWSSCRHLATVASTDVRTCGCRKPMPPGDIHESRLRRGRAAGCGSGPGR